MQGNSKNIVLYIGIVLGVLIIGTSILISARWISNSIENSSSKLRRDLLNDIKAMGEEQMKQEQPEENLKPGEKIVPGVTAGTNAIEGDPAAPVLMVEFSDFECPFSKRFYQQVFPQIQKDYISTGKVKFAYRDYPLPFHTFAKDTAIAARCAGRQNKYWQMFDQLSSRSQINSESARGAARNLRLDMKAFDACLKDDAIKDEVEKDLSEGVSYGVKGTPTFFINGRYVVGTRPFETFKEIIDNEITVSGAKK